MKGLLPEVWAGTKKPARDGAGLAPSKEGACTLTLFPVVPSIGQSIRTQSKRLWGKASCSTGGGRKWMHRGKGEDSIAQFMAW